MKLIVGLCSLALLSFAFQSHANTQGESGESAPMLSPDNCLAEQSLDAEDVDISLCPPLPALPEAIQLGTTRHEISLGAWELGQTAEGERYKYGSLSDSSDRPRLLTFYGEEAFTTVSESNLSCWAKGYYRLRKILQDPPQDYLKLHAAGFQQRFFQFQTDLRNGPTGFRKISSYRDHLVKWVTVIDEDGVCQQPTLSQFQAYLTAELERRGLAPDSE